MTVRLMRGRLPFVGAVLALVQGCAVLHSAQVGDIDSQTVMNGKRFEIKLVEVGVDIDGARDLASDIGKSYGRQKETDTVGDAIQISNLGPTTGNPVFRVDYSDHLIERIKWECPSGKVSGLISVRETSKYGLVSGEYVKLIGYCERGSEADD
jgi:hypothetical protein